MHFELNLHNAVDLFLNLMYYIIYKEKGVIMINTKDMKVSCAQVLEYLKGIRKEDLIKIPIEFMIF